MYSYNNRNKRFALILIDPQNGFINDGYWSRMFPKDQSIPIVEAFDRTALFLRSISNPETIPILISQTGFSQHDRQIYEPIKNELLKRQFSSLTYVDKPHTNLSICSGVFQWLNEQMKSKLEIVIGGCTITSCIRDSSIQMKKLFPELNFIVDKNLCSARRDNYIERCRICFENYMIDALPPKQNCQMCLNQVSAENQLLSPVQYAFQQIQDAGVTIVNNYSLDSN